MHEKNNEGSQWCKDESMEFRIKNAWFKAHFYNLDNIYDISES